MGVMDRPIAQTQLIIHMDAMAVHIARKVQITLTLSAGRDMKGVLVTITMMIS